MGSSIHTHIYPHTTLASWISVEFFYHHLNSRRDSQFGRAGPRKPPWSQVQVLPATSKPLMTWPFSRLVIGDLLTSGSGWTWKGLFVIQPCLPVILRGDWCHAPPPLLLPAPISLFCSLFGVVVLRSDSLFAPRPKQQSAEMTSPLVKQFLSGIVVTFAARYSHGCIDVPLLLKNSVVSLTDIFCMSHDLLLTRVIVPPTQRVWPISEPKTCVEPSSVACVRYWPPWKRCWVDMRLVLARSMATAREPQRIVVTLFDGCPGPRPFHVDPQREHSDSRSIYGDIIP